MAARLMKLLVPVIKSIKHSASSGGPGYIALGVKKGVYISISATSKGTLRAK